jgi:tetratricopeptide (TPR) repeat protein
VLVQLNRAAEPDARVDTLLAGDAMLFNDFPLAKKLAEPWSQNARTSLQVAIDSHRMLGQLAFQAGDSVQALVHYRLLAGYRRDANDRFIIGLCERNVGHLDQSIIELEKALVIQPDLVVAHEVLAEVLAATGKQATAEMHQAVARKLTTNEPK